MERDTIGGFNDMLEMQKEEAGGALDGICRDQKTRGKGRK